MDRETNRKFYLETFGCQMNVVDSERIVDLLQGIGYRQVEAADEADLILLNTCSIRDKAERKVYGHLGRFKPLKDRNPGLILGVGGCVAQQEGERLLEKVRYLDLVFGTHNIHKLPDMVQEVEGRRVRRIETEFLDRETRLQLFPKRAVGDTVSRFVTVMQGCDNFCSYCVVPHVRGREVSRPSDEILAEVCELAAGGVREITLIGQNVNSYGRKEPGEVSFADLLRRVHEVDGVERIRFTTSHPRDLSDELIDCFGDLEKLCKHIHLPVQSGSDRILEMMNRGYTGQDYLAKVARLKAACPQIRLTSDIIVGFPGETENDFAATLELMEEVGYADVFSFLYSSRPQTAAAQMPDSLSAKAKQDRFDRLLALQEKISRQTWAQDVGRVLPVLVEGESRQGGDQIFGRTTWNRIVNFQGEKTLVGQVVPVRITTDFRNSQLGEAA
ncbi:tRNA (N6-isopentenyl adenosine(37)-C2)-methylthiotransferase MiaB [uncultured Desulfuromonas sp.]|uniref:tRNA (N6-isopentenyl adenosine(37)-C2)-methylthiotransferase MiaB n=1 Tax=uncultured Desulfuromonas sp. TaxID=181013 RepID=UPI00261EA7D3|nr:tRNA (N6-isopentenyl adenosine(37)-C2)-methylthiotransferase MiaB [uncultured Desulfuromonas sp.]